MRCRKLLQQSVGLMLIEFLLVGCGTQPPVPVSEAPEATLAQASSIATTSPMTEQVEEASTAIPIATATEAITQAPTPTTEEEGPPTASGTVELIEGMFDIGGHSLYLSCRGTGAPTIVYLHGSIENKLSSGALSAHTIQDMLSEEYRFCVYDRRNVGKSDEVPGFYRGEEAAADLHSLLDVAEVEPPYVLLGASLGGLLSHVYAAMYPDDVVGMVLLDSQPPAELELDPLLPEDMRFKDEEDIGSNENLSHLSLYEAALAHGMPQIPVTYLHATPSNKPTLGVPAYDDVILDVLREYVDGFGPGKWVDVKSPHYMEAAVPGVIADELRDLIEENSLQQIN